MDGRAATACVRQVRVSLVAMSDVQNFFLEALAVVFVKVNIYLTSEESYR